MTAQPFSMERTFDAPAGLVWRALTEKELMKQWYFDLAEFKAVEGFQFQFTGGPAPDRQYLHLCEVTEVIPGKKLTYSWRYDGYPGNSFVTFELVPEGEKTHLTVTHAGLETFPDNPDFAKENFEKGWNGLIGKSLTDFLEKNN